MIKYIKTDLFEYIKDTKEQIIVPHVCNNKGKWGTGFVVPLGINYPRVKESYLCNIKRLKLGENDLVFIDNKLFVNMIAQTLGGNRPLYYNKLAQCMDLICSYPSNRIIAPKFGSGLAGGNWDFIKELIEDCWIKRGFDVTICYL